MIGFNRTRADHRQDHTELETPGQVDRARHVQVVPRRAGTQARGDSYPHTSVVLLVQPTGQNRPEPNALVGFDATGASPTTFYVTCSNAARTAGAFSNVEARPV
jgi:hypothetical protein